MGSCEQKWHELIVNGDSHVDGKKPVVLSCWHLADGGKMYLGEEWR
jgi:hypothetical protein